MIIGYARLTDNNPSQPGPLQVLASSGCDRVFHDTAMAAPGVDLPQRDAAAKAAAGGTLVVCGLEHLGVSLIDVMRFIVELRDSGTRLRVVEADLDSDTPISIYAMADQIIACSALLRGEAVGYGMAQAKKNGATMGRKTALSSKDKEAALALLAATGDAEAVAEKYNIGLSTIYRYKREALDN